MRLGKLQKEAYEFKKRNPEYTTYNTDSITKRVIKSLEKKGLIKTNKFNMFCLKKPLNNAG